MSNETSNPATGARVSPAQLEDLLATRASNKNWEGFEDAVFPDEFITPEHLAKFQAPLAQARTLAAEGHLESFAIGMLHPDGDELRSPVRLSMDRMIDGKNDQVDMDDITLQNISAWPTATPLSSSESYWIIAYKDARQESVVAQIVPHQWSQRLLDKIPAIATAEISLRRCLDSPEP